MKYIVCQTPGHFSMKEKSVPKAKEGEALLKIHQVGICGTDYHAYKGQQAFFSYPRILGHELAATVISTGTNPQGIKEGDQVIIMPYMSCGECLACRSAKTNCCSNIKVLGVHTDGGMQEQITVPTKFLLKANHLSLDQMVIAEPLAIGAHAIRRANLQPGETVLVIGCGPIGIGLIALAQIAGARVIAMDIDENKLQFVKDQIGVHAVIKADASALEKINSLTNGELCTAVFDATGIQKAMQSGPDYLSHGGRFVLVGLFKGELSFHHPSIHAKEASLLCSRNATLEDFETVIEALPDFPTEAYLTHRVELDEMIPCFDSLMKQENKVIKAVVKFS